MGPATDGAAGEPDPARFTVLVGGIGAALPDGGGTTAASGGGGGTTATCGGGATGGAGDGVFAREWR